MDKIAFSFALVAMLALAGCAGTQQTGVLEGHVTIGPLCPVEPCNISAEQLAKVYESRNITIFLADGITLIKEVPLNASGDYRAELAPGTYMVSIRPGGIGPYPLTQVNISANATARLDLDVDTGIR